MTTETITYESVAERADIDPEAFEAYCDNQHITAEDSAEAIVDFINAYVGQFDSEAEYAEYYYNENEDIYRLPTAILRHIDWDEVWECELRHDFYEINGYYFQNI